MDAATEAFFRAEVARNIRRARRDALLTQEALASALRTDQPQISRWENAKALPTLLQIADIAIACRRRPEALLENIVAPTREQLALRIARANSLLYELTELADSGAGQTVVPSPQGDAPAGSDGQALARGGAI